eukprot:95750-Pleurochrysis_carterae.AAC.1
MSPNLHSNTVGVVSGGVGDGGTYIFEACSLDAGGGTKERPGNSVSMNRACGETYSRFESGS